MDSPVYRKDVAMRKPNQSVHCEWKSPMWGLRFLDPYSGNRGKCTSHACSAFQFLVSLGIVKDKPGFGGLCRNKFLFDFYYEVNC